MGLIKDFERKDANFYDRDFSFPAEEEKFKVYVTNFLIQLKEVIDLT